MSSIKKKMSKKDVTELKEFLEIMIERKFESRFKPLQEMVDIFKFWKRLGRWGIIFFGLAGTLVAVAVGVKELFRKD